MEFDLKIMGADPIGFLVMGTFWLLYFLYRKLFKKQDCSTGSEEPVVQEELFSEEDVSEEDVPDGTVAAESVNTSMLDRVNHCIPSQGAYWCSQCECHSQFRYSISSSRNSQGTSFTEKYECLECGRAMICPRVVKWWLNRLIAFVFAAVIVLPLSDALLGIEEKIGSQGMVFCFIALAVVCCIPLFLLRRELAKWRAWAAQQRQKSQSELTREAEAHSHQPVYDLSNEDFDAWASQFMDPEALQQLHAKHGHDWSPPEEGKKSHWYYDPDLKVAYITLYVALVAAIIAFSVANWPASRQADNEEHTRKLEEEHARQLEVERAHNEE